MQTEPLTGARKPEQTDGPLGGLQISNAVDDLAEYAYPRFATTAARDTAYAAWVAAGGTMADGMVCSAGGLLYRYKSGAWREQFTDFQIQRVAFDTTKVPTNSVLATISIPAVPVASRVVMIATGKAGFDDTAQSVNWTYDTIPPATNVAQDDATRVPTTAGGWASLTHTLTMDLAAGQNGNPRLLMQGSSDLYNKGSVVWFRGPVSP